MIWEIVSFEAVGPIRFGMTPDEVAAIAGMPDRSRRGMRSGALNEFRGNRAPIIRYRENRVTEIEAFYDLGSVMFRGMDLFRTNGAAMLHQLEKLNGGASLSVGIVLFERLGFTTGRLDEGPRTGHSVTAFAAGLWDGKIDEFEKVSFL